MDYYWKPDLIKIYYKDYNNTILYMIPIIVTPLSQEEFIKEGFMKRNRNEYYTEEHYKKDIARCKFYQYNY
jgi:replication initiation and membrane attachment protein DnaB